MKAFSQLIGDGDSESPDLQTQTVDAHCFEPVEGSIVHIALAQPHSGLHDAEDHLLVLSFRLLLNFTLQKEG